MERPFRYIRQDFFLARAFRDLDDLNAQFAAWRSEIANPRVHATTGRIVDEAFTDERPHLIPLPALPYSEVLTVERRVSHEGMVSVDGNHYSTPDTTRKRALEALDHTLHRLEFAMWPPSVRGPWRTRDHGHRSDRRAALRRIRHT